MDIAIRSANIAAGTEPVGALARGGGRINLRAATIPGAGVVSAVPVPQPICPSKKTV